MCNHIREIVYILLVGIVCFSQQSNSAGMSSMVPEDVKKSDGSKAVEVPVNPGIIRNEKDKKCVEKDNSNDGMYGPTGSGTNTGGDCICPCKDPF